MRSRPFARTTVVCRVTYWHRIRLKKSGTPANEPQQGKHEVL